MWGYAPIQWDNNPIFVQNEKCLTPDAGRGSLQEEFYRTRQTTKRVLWQNVHSVHHTHGHWMILTGKWSVLIMQVCAHTKAGGHILDIACSRSWNLTFDANGNMRCVGPFCLSCIGTYILQQTIPFPIYRIF